MSQPKLPSLLFLCLLSLAIGLSEAAGQNQPSRRFYEVEGTVSMEAEHATHINLWKKVPGVSGVALEAEAAGTWKGGVLRFDIEFRRAGAYALWVLARKGGEEQRGKWGANDVKVWLDRDLSGTVNPTIANRTTDHLTTLTDGGGAKLYPATKPESELAFGQHSAFTWLSKPKDGPAPALWQVTAPGKHHLEFVMGEESGYAIDKIVLTLENRNPPVDLGPAETSSPDAVTGGRDADVILPPQWAFGLLYGGYTDQSGSVERVSRLIAEDYPIDAYWVDSNFWDMTGDGPRGYINFIGDKKAFPDPAAMWAAFRNSNVKAGVWVWDSVLEEGNEEVYREFLSKGYFGKVYRGTSAWHNQGTRSMQGDVDFRNREAAALWKSKLSAFFYQGLDFLKLDKTAELNFCRTAFEATQEYGQETEGRGFIISHARDTENPEFKRYPTKWTGDSKITWSQPDYPDLKIYAMGGLKENIEMVANPGHHHYAIPFLTHDAGGFKSFDSRDFGDELYTRWIQFSVFNPVMEIFSSKTNPTSNLPWGFSEETQRVFRFHTHLRMRLFPYIYTYAQLTRLTGRKMIEGDGTHRDQYLFGRELLVAPVYVKGARARTLYLPAGEWIDYWTGERYNGGRQINHPVTLARIPVFVRAGAIIPMRDYARAIELGTNDPLTLDIYPSGESYFTLFEDDGVSNAYLDGGYAATPFLSRREASRTVLEIGAANGAYAGLPRHRTYMLKFNASDPVADVRKEGAGLPACQSERELQSASAGWYYDAQKRIAWVKFRAPTFKPTTVALMIKS